MKIYHAIMEFLSIILFFYLFTCLCFCLKFGCKCIACKNNGWYWSSMPMDINVYICMYINLHHRKGVHQPRVHLVVHPRYIAFAKVYSCQATHKYHVHSSVKTTTYYIPLHCTCSYVCVCTLGRSDNSTRKQPWLHQYVHCMQLCVSLGLYPQEYNKASVCICTLYKCAWATHVSK